MFLRVVLPLALVLLPPAATDRPPDALTLLNEVGQHYADAKSYHVEAVEERSITSELNRSWQKSLMTAIVMPGGHYRYEGLSFAGNAMLISDGVHEWEYLVGPKIYTERPISTDGSEKKRAHPTDELTALNARAIVPNLGQTAGTWKSATYLPDEMIMLGEKKIDCYVVHISEDDFKAHIPFTIRETTLWIDKSHRMIVKKSEHHTPAVKRPGYEYRASTIDILTTYPVVDLDAQESASTFTFVAPKDAQLVRDLGAPGQQIDWLMGKMAPEIRLRGPDGKITTLSSLQGKPVFLDFWASWCGPCNGLIPDLLRLHAETASKGLTWVGIDNDANPDAAEKFAKEQGIPWANYHDIDGSMGAAFERHTIPLGVLINAKGQIIFYKAAYQASDLRGAIATLGPQFAEAVGTGLN